MKRRTLLKSSIVSLGATTAIVNAPVVHAKKKIRWKMVTAWPKNFPGLGAGANHLAKLINTMSAGRLQVKVYGAGEIVPAFEVFDAVSNGVAEMGHSAALYWKGKVEAAQFFGGAPYGLTCQEMNAWLYYGGGLELWRELYAPFNLLPAAAGNTGVQMAGWFNKEINSLEDLSGLKMRIPGLGGEVVKLAGATPVNIPGGEVFTALKSGAIDATEWMGPYNDLAFGFYKAAKNYYYPGWHEPGTTMECIIHKPALEKLSKDLQSIVLRACQVVNQDMSAELTVKNAEALTVLKTQHGVQVKRLPDDVLIKLRGLSEKLVTDLADKNLSIKKVYQSFSAFRKQATAWHEISERAYFNKRAI